MEKRRSWIGWMVAAAVILTCSMAAPVFAEESGPSASCAVLFSNHYIWRGQELSRDSLVIEPSITTSYKGFSANLWSNVDLDPYSSDPAADTEAKLNETDITLSYAHDFGSAGLEVGYIYYGLSGIPDTQEIYAGISANVLLSPSLKVYKDIGHGEAWYLLLGISHEFKFSDSVALDLGASISYLTSDSEDDYPEIDDNGNPTGGKFSGLHDGVVSASLPISVAKYFTVSPTVSYTFPLSTDAKNEMKWRSLEGDESFLMVGLNMDMSF